MELIRVIIVQVVCLSILPRLIIYAIDAGMIIYFISYIYVLYCRPHDFRSVVIITAHGQQAAYELSTHNIVD